MRSKSGIKIGDDARKLAIASFRRYFTENMDEEISDLKADLLLEFVISEIGPTIYNQAITDARDVMQEAALDMTGTLDRAEFPYWVKPGRAR